MGAAFPLADLSISGQLREVAKPEEFRLVPNLTDYRVYQALASKCLWIEQRNASLVKFCPTEADRYSCGASTSSPDCSESSLFC